MRQLFSNPEPFTTAVINAGAQLKFTGINVDFEPTVDGTPQDAADYATFLQNLGDRLHQAGLKLTVCIASWNPIWNWSTLAKTCGHVDRFM